MGPNRAQTVSLVVLAAIAGAFALRWLAPLLIPFTLAIFVYLGLTPLIAFQTQRLRLPRSVALLTTLVLGLVLLMLLGSLVTSSVAQLSQNSDAYAAQVAKLLQRIAALLPDRIGDASPEEEFRKLLALPMEKVGAMLALTTNALLGLLSQSLLVLVFVAFLLLGEKGVRPTGVWSEAEQSVRRFLALKGVISAATGILVGLSLSLLGVDLAMMFGLLAFLLNFVPSLGSIVATLLPLPVVVVSPDVTPAVAVLAIAIPGAIQFTVGQVLEPRVMGSSLDLHPVVVILALIFWGMLWGIVGMLLATPITAVMKIVFGKFESTRTLAEVLAGRLDALRSPEVIPSSEAV